VHLKSRRARTKGAEVMSMSVYTRTLNQLQTAITAYIRNASQADLLQLFVNNIKQVQVCTEARGRHFQHFLYVHSDFLSALYYYFHAMVFWVMTPCSLVGEV
jgi:hypothetical protein